jgi:hypothetical protein
LPAAEGKCGEQNRSQALAQGSWHVAPAHARFCPGELMKGRIMKLVALSALAALALAGAPASGQTVMLNFSFPELRQHLTDLKSTITKESDTDDKIHYLEAKTESGLIYAVYGVECDSAEATQRCKGAEIVASFSLADKSGVEEALDLIDYAAVADYKGVDENVKLSRYVIFDHGITPANFKTNIEVFLSIADKVWDKLDEADLLK